MLVFLEKGPIVQKDVHFYLTYALARSAGIKAQEAKEITWANQYTDDLTEAELYGIETQCNMGNWGDRQIQLSVLIPFHFIPGGESEWPWGVTENNERAQALVRASMMREPHLQRCALGIALHALQDTFSHQGFSGWREPNNACGFWYLLPNVGHADVGHRPDVVDLTWEDPRTKTPIDNRPRGLKAAHETFNVLFEYRDRARRDSEYRDLSRRDSECGDLTRRDSKWAGLQKKLTEIFEDKNYDERKRRLARLARAPKIRYSRLTKSARKKHGTAFVRAAAQHLSDAINLFADLSC